MIVQMKMRTGVDAFGTLSDNWSSLDLAQLNIFERHRLIVLLNQYLVLVGCGGEQCINTRLSVIEYLNGYVVG